MSRKKKVGRPGRGTVRKDRDQARIAELAVKGYTVRKIAAEVGMSPTQVQRDLDELRQEWRDNRGKNIADVENRLLAQVTEEYLRYDEAWKRSKEIADSDVIVDFGVPDEDGRMVTTKSVRTRKKQPYDTKAVDGMLKATRAAAEIEGVRKTTVAPVPLIEEVRGLQARVHEMTPQEIAASAVQLMVGIAQRAKEQNLADQAAQEITEGEVTETPQLAAPGVEQEGPSSA